MEQRSSVATKAVAAFAGGRSGHRFGERGEGGRGGCRGPQQAAGEEGEKGIPPLLATVRDEIGRKRSKMCIIISYHIFLLGNDTLENDIDNKKSIYRKRYHQIEHMSISIDNGISNRKNRNHEWTYMQHVYHQMSGQQSNMNITTPYVPIL
jgi:hypothetical protein